VGTSLFSRGTAVDNVGDGRFRADLGDHWNCPIVPQGGIVVATAARAMESALGDPAQTLRSLSGVFAGQVRHGPVEIHVSVLRRGRSMSQLHASLRNPGEEAGFDALAVFGAEREGFVFTDATAPAVPAPLECPAYGDGSPAEWNEGRVPFNFWEHVEGRAALGHAPWEDYEAVSSLCASWYRFVDPARGDDGTWDPYAVVALCDTMPGAVGEMLVPAGAERAWLPPSADFTVHVFGPARGDWILGVNRARHAGDGYASADMEMWDYAGPESRLVAYATQTMVFSFPRTGT
jgi:acyl-CoA thioesterase